MELAPSALTWPQILVTLWGELQLVSHVWDGDQLLLAHFELMSTGQVFLHFRPSLMLFLFVGYMSGQSS